MDTETRKRLLETYKDKILDGNALAREIHADLKKKFQTLNKKASLLIVQVGRDPRTIQFVGQKMKTGNDLGVSITHQIIEALSEQHSREEREKFKEDIRSIVTGAQYDGVIIQLPIPYFKGGGQQEILDYIPSERDVDVLSVLSTGDFRHGMRLGKEVLPPVVGSVAALMRKYGITYEGADVVVEGLGKLVGGALDTAFKAEDYGVQLLTIKNPAWFRAKRRKEADMLVLGVPYAPRFVTADMIKEGVIIFDAGTCEDKDGRITGNVDFSEEVLQKVAYITPVPGGIGPLTVILLYVNLFLLMASK